MVQLLPVVTESDKRRFYRFASRLHGRDPTWVPPVWPQRKAYLDKTAPFFRHGEGAFWIARDGNGIVGTVGAAVDHAQNRHLGTNAAIFGFFDVLPDRYPVAAALWDQVRAWARERGLTEVQGPRSFGPYEDRGFLVEGFDRQPGSLLAHSPPYYHEFAVRYGWEVRSESIAYRLDLRPFRAEPAAFPRSALRAAARARARHGPGLVRPVRLSDWDHEIACVHEIYNRAQASIEDFVPVEFEEFRRLARTLRPIVDPDLIILAEAGGRPIGLAIAYPDLAELVRRAKGLRHFWNYLTLILAKRRAKGTCFKVLAVAPEHRAHGVDAALCIGILETAARKGYEWMELSLTDARNHNTTGIAEKFGASVDRRYRDYRIGV